MDQTGLRLPASVFTGDAGGGTPNLERSFLGASNRLVRTGGIWGTTSKYSVIRIREGMPGSDADGSQKLGEQRKGQVRMPHVDAQGNREALKPRWKP